MIGPHSGPKSGYYFTRSRYPHRPGPACPGQLEFSGVSIQGPPGYPFGHITSVEA